MLPSTAAMTSSAAFRIPPRSGPLPGAYSEMHGNGAAWCHSRDWARISVPAASASCGHGDLLRPAVRPPTRRQ